MPARCLIIWRVFRGRVPEVGEVWGRRSALSAGQWLVDGSTEFAGSGIPPLGKARALGFGQRPVDVEGDGVAVVGGVGRAGDEEEAGW